MTLQSFCARTLAFSLALILAPLASAQVGPGGNAGGGGAGATTTEGFGGSTTDGFGTTGLSTQEGAFVGAGDLESFIGAGVTTDRNGNRQFRSITNPTIATGGNRQTGTPRIKRTQLRIAFQYPQPAFLPLVRQRQQLAIRQVATVRPSLNSVSVRIDDRGIATLSGAAPDAASRRLAANLLRLEPGVRRIRNDIAINAQN